MGQLSFITVVWLILNAVISRVDQSDFMRYMEVENHDDFYSFDCEGSVHVWDQRGVAILYDSSMEDLKKLETELLMVGSYYMRKVGLKEL